MLELDGDLVEPAGKFERGLSGKFAAPDPHRRAVNIGADAVPDDGFELGNQIERTMQLPRRVGNGLADRMLAIGFHSTRPCDEVSFTGPVDRDDVGDRHGAFGEGAGLVKHHGGDTPRPFEYLDRFDENSKLRSTASTNHDRHRSCQPERTWARDDQHCNGGVHAITDAATDHGPAKECQQRNEHHDRDEHRRDSVSQTLRCRLSGLGVFDKFDNLGKCRFRADRSRSDSENARAVDRGACNPVALLFVDWERFAGQHRFVDSARSVDDFSIDGHLFARSDLHQVTNLYRFDRHHLFDTIANKACLFGAQLNESS